MSTSNEIRTATGMTRAEILEGIAGVARDQLAWNGRLSEEMRLIETLGLDSLRMLTLVVEMEDRFRVCLDEEVDAQIETVADLVDAIRSKLDSRSADAD